ncbi:methylmalonyl-CoA mutase subunit beta [Neobacillus niacini]|uniref:methylmalonyl-CoA mutase subunit beta n=1 Tax=Neobacillus niacini TaxID=86668 RepID=UPI002FFDA0E7
MSLEDLRNQTFPLKAKEDWKDKAEESLKGKSVEFLKSSTYENIVLEPLYSRGDEKHLSEYPGGSDFRRGINPLGYVTNDWRIAQRVSYKNAGELKDKLQETTGKGQTALSFEVSKNLWEIEGTLIDLLGNLPKDIPFAINGKGLQKTLLEELAGACNAEQLSGYVANDPLSLFAEEGIISEEFFSEWLKGIKLANEKLPNLRTVLINTSSYHHGGANAVQELGIAAATGSFYLQQLLESGIKLEEALTKMIFQFSIGSNFFMELAKLRAARILWDKITKVYGAEAEDRGMQIAAETSLFTKTVYDPHVNILRAGNEAFAAVVGGVQYLHVTPFDDVTGSSQLSERIARNTQNILKDESHLRTIVDPAGGSWYIEALTTELAEKAWHYFQEIEAKGAMLEVLKSGWLKDEISTVHTKRMQDIFTRKQSIVGTNVYANLAETVAPAKEIIADNYFENGHSTIKINAITNTRLSEPFEELRKISQRIKGRLGSNPAIGMICLGERKQYKPRLDFMKGFLAAGGMRVAESESIISLETAKQFILNQDTKYFCLCGTNDQYESIGHDILAGLNQEFSDRKFFLAGLPEKEMRTQWTNEGIKQFIHLNSNCFETISLLLTEMEVAIDEVSKA